MEFAFVASYVKESIGLNTNATAFAQKLSNFVELSVN